MSGPSPAYFALIPMLAVFGAVAFGCWHAQRKRELEHVERLKALELGRPMPGQRAWTGALCAAIGAGVPVAALAAGLAATALNPFSWMLPHERIHVLDSRATMGYFYAVWTCVSIVGVAGVVCGSVLSVLLLGRAERAPSAPAGKFRLDPDAYDTVAGRG